MWNQASPARVCLAFLLLISVVPFLPAAELHLTEHDVLETHGLSVLLFHNPYHKVFGDQKMNGMEIILHDQRIATGGDVRLSATPDQWDPIPEFKERKRGPATDEVSAFCTYADRDLSYRINVRPESGGFRVAVQLDRAVPASLAGRAGFNLEFLPSHLLEGSRSVPSRSWTRNSRTASPVRLLLSNLRCKPLFPRIPMACRSREADGARIRDVPVASGVPRHRMSRMSREWGHSQS